MEMAMTTTVLIVAALVLLAIVALVLMRRGPAANPADPLPSAEEALENRHFAEAVLVDVPGAPFVPPIAVDDVAADAPVEAPPHVASPSADAPSDDLSRLKGVGPKLLAILSAEGVTRFAQIAAWTDADIAAFDSKLGNFAGRPVRDNWVDQARLLAAGDIAGYEARYGKL